MAHTVFACSICRSYILSVWNVNKPQSILNKIPRLMAETDVVLYCDFHGHNRKNNVFMYGCISRGDASLKLHERVFPLMMSKNASNKVKSLFEKLFQTYI